MRSGPGLTINGLFELLPDREIRRFLDPGVLSVLDAIFGGRIASDDLPASRSDAGRLRCSARRVHRSAACP